MKQVTATEVFNNLNAEDVVIIDVRTESEYKKGHLEGSVNIPLTHIPEEIENVVVDKKSTIYVYCLSGSRSDIAAETLESVGYKNSFSMTSGLLAWRMKGYPLLT